MAKKRRTGLILSIVTLLIVFGLLGWFLSHIFEGEKPSVALEPLPQYLSGEETFSLRMGDKKRGLKRAQAVVIQEGRETAVFEESFPFEGFLNRDGVREYEKRFTLDLSKLNLAQGRVDLSVRVWDYSRRSGGDGNLSVLQHKMIVDTIPPAIRALSRMHNVNVGGTGLVVYQASSDTAESGVYVNDLLFPGFPVEEASQEGSHVCYFALPHNVKGRPDVFLWAKDEAGNASQASFYIHILDKRFRTDHVNITDSFLSQVLPYFSFYPLDSEKTDIDKFVKINRDLRKENAEVFYGLREQWPAWSPKSISGKHVRTITYQLGRKTLRSPITMMPSKKKASLILPSGDAYKDLVPSAPCAITTRSESRPRMRSRNSLTALIG